MYIISPVLLILLLLLIQGLTTDPLDHKIETLLRDWHQSADMLFSVHPIDGSFLVWWVLTCTLFICLLFCLFVCLFLWLSIHTQLPTYMCVYVHLFVYMCVCVCVYACMCVYVFVCLFMCLKLHITMWRCRFMILLNIINH